MFDTALRLARESPALALMVCVGGGALVTIATALWMEDRRYQRLVAIEAKRDALLQERDRLWREGP